MLYELIEGVPPTLYLDISARYASQGDAAPRLSTRPISKEVVWACMNTFSKVGGLEYSPVPLDIRTIKLASITPVRLDDLLSMSRSNYKDKTKIIFESGFGTYEFDRTGDLAYVLRNDLGQVIGVVLGATGIAGEVLEMIGK